MSSTNEQNFVLGPCVDNINWVNQDTIIEKIENKIRNLNKASWIAEKGMAAFEDQETVHDIKIYDEFKAKSSIYSEFAKFLEGILKDINDIKLEEIKQLEDAEEDLRINKRGI